MYSRQRAMLRGSAHRMGEADENTIIVSRHVFTLHRTVLVLTSLQA